MSEQKENDQGQEYDQSQGPSGRSGRLVLAGRIERRERGAYQIELIEGLTVDVREEDCARIEETTDPVTMRAMVVVELKGDRPITATFQPHLYRVLAEAGATPFAFGSAADVPPDQFDLSSSFAAGPGGGGPGGGGGGGFQQPSISETKTRSRNWIQGWVNDDNRIDTKEDAIF